MDTPHNNEENRTESRNTPMRTETISFLREDYGMNIDRIRNFFNSEQGRRAAIIAAAIIAAVVVLWIFASMSLPGQPLYGVKTNVFENVRGAFSLTTESKARHNLSLMHERLTEVKRLAAQESVEENAVAAFSNRTNKNAAAFVSLTEGSEERTLDREAVINLTNDFASVTSAIEEISEDHPSLLPVADGVADIRRDALRRLDDEVEVYVSLVGDEDLREFLMHELERINDRVSRGDLSEDTTTRVGRSLASVATAITANDAADAVEGIFEAHRLITAEEYLESNE